MMSITYAHINKTKTRLIVGDMFWASLEPKNQRPYWTLDALSDGLSMSFDPVAHDVIGLETLKSLIDATYREPRKSAELKRRQEELAQPWLKHSGAAGLGESERAKIQFFELKHG